MTFFVRVEGFRNFQVHLYIFLIGKSKKILNQIGPKPNG